MLRVAVIGFGVGEQHALAFHAHPKCRLVAICDIDENARHAARSQFPEVEIGSDPTTVIADRAIDIVSIASYDDAHFQQVALALRHGKHVFVEKPLCRTIDELRHLKSLWSMERPAVMSNLILRCAPLYEWIFRERREGAFGDVYAFDGDYLYGRIEKITDGWRKEVESYSVMLGGGIHLVDLMFGVTGERPSAVTALGNRVATRGTAFRYDDFVAATYRFESGLIGRVTANFGSVHPHQHVVRVFGTHASIIADDRGARMRKTREPKSPAVVIDLAAVAPKGALIPTFVDQVISGTRRAEAAQREWDLISACVAADESLRARDEVDITYV